MKYLTPFLLVRGGIALRESRSYGLVWTKFGNVHSSFYWKHGPAGHSVHESCRKILCNATKLEQTKKRPKVLELEQSPEKDSSVSVSSCSSSCQKASMKSRAQR